MNTRRFFIGIMAILAVLVFLSFNLELSQSAPVQPVSTIPISPECWTALEKISYTGMRSTREPQSVQRLSIYEIHEDDSVNPNHSFTGLPYFATYTWTGSTDVEWLVLEGNFSHYVINESAHSVTFYDLQDWLHVVYRTNNFIQRTTDQIRFCVYGGNVEGGVSMKVKVLYPANYNVSTVIPGGYTQPAAGELAWDFGVVIGYQVDTYFSGLGPDRPLLDLPVDYTGRTKGSSIAFSKAYNTRIISMFDHRYPNGVEDQKFLSYTGFELDNPGDGECTTGFNCYDGHNGYDFNDQCTWQSPCANPQAVYPAAAGNILSGETGWDNALGCRITIDHGNNWKTLYAHLQDANKDHSCNGILIPSGYVTSSQQIGIIGGTGTQGGGDDHPYLHFSVFHNGIAVDPSGWEPNASLFADPWREHGSGTASYPMWKYALRSTRAFASNYGGILASPTHITYVNFPSGYYAEPLLFNISDIPAPPSISPNLLQTGNSFSLSAIDLSGNFIHQLSQPATLTMTFNLTDTKFIAPDISFYTWNPNSSAWEQLSTNIDWNSHIAITQIDHLSFFALAGRPLQKIYLPLTIK